MKISRDFDQKAAKVCFTQHFDWTSYFEKTANHCLVSNKTIFKPIFVNLFRITEQGKAATDTYCFYDNEFDGRGDYSSLGKDRTGKKLSYCVWF